MFGWTIQCAILLCLPTLSTTEWQRCLAVLDGACTVTYVHTHTAQNHTHCLQCYSTFPPANLLRSSIIYVFLTREMCVHVQESVQVRRDLPVLNNSLASSHVHYINTSSLGVKNVTSNVVTCLWKREWICLWLRFEPISICPSPSYSRFTTSLVTKDTLS